LPPAYIQTTTAVSAAPAILEVHTPVSSFAIQHSLVGDNLTNLYGKLSRKANTGANGIRVGVGWLKYEWNGTVWNLDDDSDYAIFVWRQQSQSLSTSSAVPPPPTLYFQNTEIPLPEPPAYFNPSFYLFRPVNASSSAVSVRTGRKSIKTRHPSKQADPMGFVPQHKKDFIKFHSENGVRTVMGKVGPVDGVRMLLKKGYRHVYMSRAFAKRHTFIPKDAAPGSYGYSGLVDIGKWPLTLGHTTTTHTVFLSEETHFDIILGRSFMEVRGVKTDPLDPTSVVCMDTGESLECELVIIRDGKGEIVTIT